MGEPSKANIFVRLFESYLRGKQLKKCVAAFLPLKKCYMQFPAAAGQLSPAGFMGLVLPGRQKSTQEHVSR